MTDKLSTKVVPVEVLILSVLFIILGFFFRTLIHSDVASNLPSLRLPASMTDSESLSSDLPSVASQNGGSVTYKITDGYGTYTGRASTKIHAAEIARTDCIMNKVAMYESRNGGVTPDADTVDLFIDSCLNK